MNYIIFAANVDKLEKNYQSKITKHGSTTGCNFHINILE